MPAIAVAGVSPGTGDAPLGVGETLRSEWRLGVFHFAHSRNVLRNFATLGAATAMQ